MAGRRRSDRALRGKLGSSGRPLVARREDRRRFWALIAMGLSSEMRRLAREYRSRLGHDGSGRQAGCHQRRLYHHQGRCPGGSCRLRSAKSLRSCRCRALASGRLAAGWGGRDRRSPRSCGAMPQHAAAASSTGPPRRSGMRSGRRVVQNRPSWRATRRCGRMCRTGCPARSLFQAGPRCPGRRCRGRAGGTVPGRTGAGPGRGVRCRLSAACGLTSPRTRRCASATRPSTSRSTCKARGRCGAS
jgi:hypothetical protein